MHGGPHERVAGATEFLGLTTFRAISDSLIEQVKEKMYTSPGDLSSVSPFP